jgi:hypothetical protein
MKRFLKRYLFIGFCILFFAVVVFYAPINFWIQFLNFSEKLIFQRQISYNRFNVPESWFELRQDKFDASIPEAVITDFQTAILNYLNTGGSVEQLNNEFNAVPGILYFNIQQVDFSDNGSQEVVIAIEFLRRSKHGSFIWVIGEIDGIYKVLFQTGDNDWLIYHPYIILINDINEDGIKEVVASTMWIGSEKEIRFYVLAPYLPSQSVTTLFSGDIVPFGDVEISINNIDDDSVKEITLTGYRWQNGVREKITYEYKWNGNFYDLFKTFSP